MTDRLDYIKSLYGASYRTYGDSPSSLLTPKGRNEIRFRAIDPFVIDAGTRVLDYGCGLGYLYKYLHMRGQQVDYTGYDIVPDFVQACAEKYPEASFKQIDALGEIAGEFDVVFASGVFNLRTHSDAADSKAYAFDRISALFAQAQKVLVCDFPSAFVDFEQSGAQHFSPGEIAEFCYRRLGRRFQVRHDLLPYEFTLIVWRDDAIKRPDNVFAVD